MGFLAKLTGFDKFVAQQNALYMTDLYYRLSAEQRSKLAARALDVIAGDSSGHSSIDLIEAVSLAPRGVQMQWLANAALDLGIGTGIENAIFTRVKDPLLTKNWFSDKEMAYTMHATQKSYSYLTFSWPGDFENVCFAAMMYGYGSPELEKHQRLVREEEAA